MTLLLLQSGPGRAGAAGVGGTTGVTWDAATATAVTLSGSNLVATNTGTTSADQGARVATVHGKTAGKYYFETTWTTATSTSASNRSVGIGTTASTYTAMGAGGTTGVVIYVTNNAYSNGVAQSNWSPDFVAGEVIGIAADLDNRKIWFRYHPTGQWNGAASFAQNPATNTGGLTIPAGTMVPFCTFGGTGGAVGNVFTANFGASAFVDAVPSGFEAGWLVAAAAVPVDPDISDVVLLMSFANLTDESPSLHGTALAIGSAAVDATQSVFGGSSLHLSGGEISFPDSDDFNLGDEDFTVECWIRPTTVTGIHDIIGQWEDLSSDLGWILSQNGAGLQLNVSTTGLDDIVVLSASSVLTANAWHAIAVDFDGTKYRLYVNGAMVASSTTLHTVFDSSYDLGIGGTVSSPFVGWIDELRVTRVARYHSDSGYTVASSPYPRPVMRILTADAATYNLTGTGVGLQAGTPVASDPYWANVKFLSGFEGADLSTGAPGMTDESPAASGTGTATSVRISTTQSKFGTSSLQCIAGNGQWASSANHALGSAPFTFEAWVYPSSVSGVQVLAGKCGNASPNLGWLLYNNGAVLTLLGSSAGTASTTVVSGGTMTINTWQHVCVDFDGTKYRLYRNGTMVGSSTTLISFFNPAKGLTFGATADNANWYSGWIDEARLTIGVARYASDSGYTVATTAFPRSGPAVTYVTWDTATATAVTLSGGDLVATNTGTTSADQGARVAAANGKTSGKYYFETTWTTVTSGNSANSGVGIGISASTYTGMGNVASTGVNGYRAGSIYANGSNSGVLSGTIMVAGVTMGIAVDLDNRKMWFRQSAAGNWNNNATYSPVTNVGGVTIPAGTMVPFTTFGGGGGLANNVLTANFGASAFTGAVPSGFTSGWPVNPYATFNPADLSTVTLSNGDLRATVGGGSGGVRSNTAKSSGKYYVECTYTTINTNSILTGISLSTAPLVSPTTGAANVQRTTGNITVNNVGSGSSLGIIGAGGVVGLAIDFTAKLIWFRLGAGNWNGSGTADPATGAGGINITSISTGPLYLFMSGQTGDVITANFGQNAFTQAVPSGFTSGWPV